MKTATPTNHGKPAFTLVEVLLVVVLIGVVLAVFATFSMEPNMSRQLNWGSQFMSAKLREVRGVAAMRMTPARLLVHADPQQPELMWQSCMIVAETEIGSDVWESVSIPEKLPRGVCWVSPAGVPGWTGPVSEGGKVVSLLQGAGMWREGVACWAYEYTPTARITGPHYDLFLAEGSTLGGIGQLNHPKSYRGLRVNAYGQVFDIADMVQIK